MHNLTVTLVNDIDTFRSLRDDWNDLNDRADKGSVFSSWEWLFTWWEVYQHDATRQLNILCCYQGDTLVGIAPLQILTHYKYLPCPKQLMLIGTGETDGGKVLTEYLDLIIHAENAAAVIGNFSNYLMSQQKLWQGANFPQLLENSHLSQLFAGQNLSIKKVSTEYGFRTLIDLPETYKDYLMSLKKKKRNNITRMLTRLQTEQNYVIEHLSEGLDADSALTAVANLNRARRDDLQQDSAFHYANFEMFHRLVVKRLQPLNKVEIRVLRIEDKPVAALYSVIGEDTLHAYQCGFEAKLGHRYALQTMMISQEISHCIDNPDIKRFNFMFSEDEHSYKLSYSAFTEVMVKLSFFPNNRRTQLHLWVHGPFKAMVKKLLGK
ncbi:GNAT family N-acetyltransferase [Leucothrix sargassi]|nr:GNAT family N-acetyltransferase [Leucothrix sargassi]